MVDIGLPCYCGAIYRPCMLDFRLCNYTKYDSGRLCPSLSTVGSKGRNRTVFGQLGPFIVPLLQERSRVCLFMLLDVFVLPLVLLGQKAEIGQFWESPLSYPYWMT